MVVCGAQDGLWRVASALDALLFRVHSSEVEDAVQDALFEAWRDLAAFPTGKEQARKEMLRVASRVAQRYRRRAARIVYADELEARDSRDVETWIAMRVLWLEALLRLDERSRTWLVAYHIDGRTHKQMGADWGEKEDTMRKRVDVAEKKLRKEVEKLLETDEERRGLSLPLGFVVVFDPFDRATIRAILDVEEEFGFELGPASSVRPKVKTNSWPWQFVPMGALVAALLLVPGQGWRVEPLHAEKMAKLALPSIEVRPSVPSTVEGLPKKAEPNQGKTVRHVQPVLSPEEAEIVKKLRAVGPFRGQ